MNSQEILVKVNHLYRYYDDHCAVRDVSFELRKGEVLGFLGPNGAGKSTTMQVLSGNLAPSAGQILINGVDILDNPREAKSAIGYLPEQPPVYPELTVDEYLDYCARLNRIPRQQVTDARNRAKLRCGLKDTGNRLIGNLSKGFQQRVGIAQAIIHSPSVVILDEPTVGLDPIQIREIRALIAELGKAHSVILSTHILPEVQTICSRVQIINRGVLVFNDTIAALNDNMQPGSLLLGFARPPAEDALLAITGVDSIERIDPQHFRVGITADKNPAESIVAQSVEQDWGLQEMTPERKSLEQIFVELTMAENGTQPSGEKAA